MVKALSVFGQYCLIINYNDDCFNCSARYQPLGSLLADLAAGPPIAQRERETRYQPLAEKTDILLRESSGNTTNSRLATRLHRLQAMMNESLHVYLQPLEKIRGIFADCEGGDIDPSRAELVNLAAVSGVVKSAKIRLKQTGSSGLLEPSGRPVVLRDIGQPFVNFEKRYWMSALNMKDHLKLDELNSADQLQVAMLLLKLYL